MKLCTFRLIGQQGKTYLGIDFENQLVDLTSIAQQDELSVDSVESLIRGETISYSALLDWFNGLSKERIAEHVVNDEVEFLPPVQMPQKVICIGLNYRKHAYETNSPIPQHPVVFSKFPNSITSHHKYIKIPVETQQLDYEAELAIIIGQQASQVSEEEALSTVFGYTIANDVSARDLQNRTSQWLLGKACDDFAPLGPYVVTGDDISNPNELEIKLTLNGDVRQLSNTSDMIFDCKAIISYLSKFMTLMPGDVILTGTPEGVILGLPEEQRVWIKPGDEISVKIERIGVLTNRFI